MFPARLSVFGYTVRDVIRSHNDSSVQDVISALGKAHMRCTPSLRSFPSVAFETVSSLVVILQTVQLLFWLVCSELMALQICPFTFRVYKFYIVSASLLIC